MSVIAALVVVSAAFLLTKHELFKERPRTVLLSVDRTTSLRVAYDAQKEGGISPACGCKHPQGSNWRGVTFTGRSITLARRGLSSWTQWLISVPEEGPIELSGDVRSLPARALRARIPRGGHFDPRLALDGRLPRAWRARQIRVNARRIQIVDRGTLHAYLGGPVPVGAWVPMPGSRVNLDSLPSLFPQRPGKLSLTESYPEHLGDAASSMAGRLQRYPLGDLLGPRLVLWTRDERARIPGTALGRGRPGTITAVVLPTSVFAVRVAAVPLSDAERSFHREVETNARDNLHHGQGDLGQLRLTVGDQLTRPEYDAILAETQRKRSIAVTLHGSSTNVASDEQDSSAPRGYFEVTRYPYPPLDDTATEADGSYVNLVSPENDDGVVSGGSEKIRDYYPPLPAHRGFNVFGPLRDVDLDAATGTLRVGSRKVELLRQDVRLGNPRYDREGRQQQPAAVPLTTESSDAHLEFGGIRSVTVDGRDLTSYWAQHPGLLERVGTILSILAALGGAGTGLRRLAKWTEARRASKVTSEPS